MKKNKLLTPAGVLGIIGGSFTVLAAIVILVQIVVSSAIGYFLALFVVAIIIFLVGVFTIIVAHYVYIAIRKKLIRLKARRLV